MNNINILFNLNTDSASKIYKKGTILQRAGDPSSHLYYVKKGLLKSYTIDKKGKEHIFMFAPEGWLMSDIESQEFNKEAVLFFECLEDSDLIKISKEQSTRDDLSKEQYLHMSSLLLRRVGVLQRRIIMLMSASAKERYEHFLETYPELPNRLPQRLIASYLGITPESLSKIRGEMLREK